MLRSKRHDTKIVLSDGIRVGRLVQYKASQTVLLVTAVRDDKVEGTIVYHTDPNLLGQVWDSCNRSSVEIYNGIIELDQTVS